MPPVLESAGMIRQIGTTFSRWICVAVLLAILAAGTVVVHEKAMYAHLWQQAFVNGVGPRVAESGFGLIPGYAYSGPYEDVTLTGK